MNSEEKKIIKACLKGKRLAQRALYDQYKGGMFSICLRYAHSRQDAEDILQDGFIKVFRDLKTYKPIAPLGAWMRKLMVNTALEHLRRNQKHSRCADDNILVFQADTGSNAFENMKADDLLKKIKDLPEDFRTVFNLYAIEGYSHKEIADMFEISEANSKVRLNRARNILKSSVAETLNFGSNER